MKQKTINHWQNFKFEKYITIYEFEQKIKNCFYEDQIKSYQEAKKKEDPDAEELKKSLPAVTFSALYGNIRSNLQIAEYYGIMVLDLDNITDEEEYQLIYSRAKQIPFTTMAFRSPSGLGMKIIVQTNNEDYNAHDKCYKKLVAHYEEVLDFKLDSKTCDVARLCFYSADPDIYYNENAITFEFESPEKKFNRYDSVLVEDSFGAKIDFKIAVDFTENISKFEEGNRNNFLYLLGLNCNGFGLSLNDILTYAVAEFGQFLDEVEICTAIKNGYKMNKEKHGQWKARMNKLRKSYVNKKIGNTYTSKGKQTSLVAENREIFHLKKSNDFYNSLESENERTAFVQGMLTVLNSNRIM